MADTTTATKPKAWSYSALTSYETCPRRHYETKVIKRVKEPETEALRWGSAVHKALEMRVKKDKPLPTGMTQWEPLVQKIANVGGFTLTESQYALDENFNSVHWFHKDVWMRMILDFGKLRDTSLLALDYKTGKVKEDIDQLKLFAAVMFKIYPDVEKIVTGYVWLKDKKVTKETFQREQLPDLWGAFIPRVNRLQAAHDQNDWPEKPSGLCRAWCPVTACQFNGRH